MNSKALNKTIFPCTDITIPVFRFPESTSIFSAFVPLTWIVLAIIPKILTVSLSSFIQKFSFEYAYLGYFMPFLSSSSWPPAFKNIAWFNQYTKPMVHVLNLISKVKPIFSLSDSKLGFLDHIINWNIWIHRLILLNKFCNFNSLWKSNTSFIANRCWLFEFLWWISFVFSIACFKYKWIDLCPLILFFILSFFVWKSYSLFTVDLFFIRKRRLNL